MLRPSNRITSEWKFPQNKMNYMLAIQSTCAYCVCLFTVPYEFRANENKQTEVKSIQKLKTKRKQTSPFAWISCALKFPFHFEYTCMNDKQHHKKHPHVHVSDYKLFHRKIKIKTTTEKKHKKKQNETKNKKRIKPFGKS